MRIDLLPKNLNYYKANLHSHSTLSTGRAAPEEMKRAYKEKGYSVLAMTDHNVFIPHNDMSEDDFLMLNGIEYNIDARDGSYRTCHFCAIASDERTELQPLFHRTEYFAHTAKEAVELVKFDERLPDYVRRYSHEGVSEMMRTCRDAGFFVTYNHPCWSLEHYPEYMGYEGMHAIEIVNHTCVERGYPEVNEQVYDDMLTGGKRVFCSANDDSHSTEREIFGAFNVIGAEKLSYKAITDALLAGRYYASTGAKIDTIYIEDGRICVEAPDAREIRVFTGFRKAYREVGTKDAPVTRLSVPLPDVRCKYFRVTVTDFDGNRAYSRAYFFDELGITLAEPQ